MPLRWIGMILIGCVPAASADEWIQTGPGDFAAGFSGTEIDSLGRLTLASFRGANLALEASAVSGQNELRASRSVTDGSTDTEWRFDNRTEVLGEWIRVDLGGDRGVTRVRILPGKTIDQRPLFFLKGYRLEMAREATPDDWILVAQWAENTRPTVDTSVDSTWIETDADGVPLPVLGRFLRLRIVREDPPNWVTVGEIEVFGEGFRGEGSFESTVFDAGQPVNFGRARIAGQAPPGTILRLQLRTSADGETWEPWYRVPAWDLEQAPEGFELSEPEPARFLQYRAAMETHHPLVTPALEEVRAAFVEQLFATAATAAIEPLRPMLGRDTLFTYTLDVDVGARDLGFDRVRIGLPGDVREVRFDGVSLPEDGYGSEWDDREIRLGLTAEYRIHRPGRLEVDFSSALLRPTLAVRAGIALGDSADFQNARPAREGAWTLVGQGFTSRPLPPGGVEVRPNPFNAASGPAQIQIDLAKVQHPRGMTVALYDLSGRRVRTLWADRPASAGRKRLPWDGRDDAGRLVVPGLYLLRVEIRADVDDVWTGTVGVVY